MKICVYLVKFFSQKRNCDFGVVTRSKKDATIKPSFTEYPIIYSFVTIGQGSSSRRQVCGKVSATWSDSKI